MRRSYGPRVMPIGGLDYPPLDPEKKRIYDEYNQMIDEEREQENRLEEQQEAESMSRKLQKVFDLCQAHPFVKDMIALKLQNSTPAERIATAVLPALIAAAPTSTPQQLAERAAAIGKELSRQLSE